MVECLPSVLEALDSIPRTAKNKTLLQSFWLILKNWKIFQAHMHSNNQRKLLDKMCFSSSL